jgi:hypothetical protein
MRHPAAYWGQFVRFFPSIFLGLVGLFAILSSNWRLFFVPTLNPSFADLRSITSTTDCYNSNSSWSFEDTSCDPWGRAFNYPKVWLSVFSSFGFSEKDTFALGLTSFVILWTSLLYWNHKLTERAASYKEIALLTALYLSPPVLLLIERGNTDSIMFAAATWIVASTHDKHPFTSSLFFAILAYFKLFLVGPLLANLLTIKNWRGRVFNATLIILLVFLLWHQIFYFRTNTSFTFWTSFGLGVIPLGIANIFGSNINSIFAFLAGGVIFAFSLLLVWLFGSTYYYNLRNESTKKKFSSWPEIPFLSIVVTSCVFGSSYDYRLVFIIPILLVQHRNKELFSRFMHLLFWVTVMMYASRLGIWSIFGDFLFNFIISHFLMTTWALFGRYSVESK